MHSDDVSTHASAHRACSRYGLMVNVLVWHGSHGTVMASWSSSMRMDVSRRPSSMTCPWPERADMDVPMAVCMAAMMGKLSTVPSDEQIALQSENLASSCHTTRVGVSRA